jgi:homoserine O-acetyltransferase/O-succinyltransferase
MNICEMRTKKGIVISFSSDWFYHPSQSREIVRPFTAMNMQISYNEIETEHGHDVFLTDYEKPSHLIKGFLDSLG